ncbi:DUF3526 domain-containing protein [Pseudoduganella lurida]|uniref:DUF3526 domain-containing protein n=1 Tax=Pseudoduganella lurida TaxID=1036180 RepID=UPI0013153FAD|nr:DUF3526 domain-containing protein [Pseudoduganella lurida]
MPAASSGRRWWRACHGAWQADWRERRRDWRVWLVLGLGMLLAICAGVLAAVDLQGTLDARQVAAQAERERWEHQGAKNPHSAAHYGVYVFKPLAALAALDPGVERYVGSSVWLEAHKQNELVYRPASDEPGASRQFRLTPALLLQVLAPVAMIFLGFGMFAAERERGTLPALRVNAAPLGAIGVARAAVLLCLAGVIALPACAAVALVELRGGGAEPFTDGAARVALFGIGYLLYLATWAALVTAVSAWAPTMRASLGVLVALWAATTLVLPRAAVELAQSTAPLPTMQQFRERVDTDLGMPDDPAEAERHKQQILKDYGVRDVSELPVNWAGISLARGEAHGNRVFDRHYSALFDAMARQSDAVALGGWLSPTVAVAGLSSYVAGSDTASHIQFVRGAESQRRRIQTVLNDAITSHPERDGKKYEGDAALWRSVPPFRFTYAPIEWSHLMLTRLLPLLALLAASTLLARLGVRRLRLGSLQ